jgi:dienelactone hydrolase
LVALAGSLCFAGRLCASAPEGLEDVWDQARYIGLDEIEPGMEAYCLTEYGVAGIEKFALKVVDVVRNIGPGRDAIMVEGVDERFARTGPVAGCSGSPVYIDGRLAGALAFTWPYAKDPLYGATPIGEMLMIGRGGQSDGRAADAAQAGFSFDFTTPIDLAEVDRQLRNAAVRTRWDVGGMTHLPCPLVTAGLPAEVAEQLSEAVEPMGFMVVAGGGSGSREVPSGAGPRLAPGASLAVPMVSGDMTLCTYGTVTDVVGDKVYGFGHSLLGYGEVDLPMATAKVHTVVSTISSSFKLASLGETVGALAIDESAGIIGRIGREARTIPLTIRIDRFNYTQQRVYNCRLAYNRLLTPLYLRATVMGAALQLGDFPPDHTLEYKIAIGLEGGRSITSENVSTSLGLNEIMIEIISSVGLLMNNPYERVGIESLDFDIRILPKNIVSHIWSAELSDAKVKAGDSVTDLYGVMYKPFDFDEEKRYPIIAYVYPGPQTEAVNKSFTTRAQNVMLAQLGFIVIEVGNRGGHPARSKWYHNYGYGNLRDYGLADKKTAIEQLAARHDFIDIDRVGIFGHSGGGFMSTAAMLVYPDFFKVAVSSSGNHENQIYNRWWSEKHHGVKEVTDEEGNVTFEYDIDKNSEIAENLKGRLLLATGDIDNNVHPGNTIRLAEALIKANKRFDFFLFPGQRHGFGMMNEYFFWLRADYFCKHLIGDYSQDVDIEELNREEEEADRQRRRR